MAAIDSLLRVMVLRDAEAMTVTSGQVPSLRRGGNAEPMAMPVLDAAMVAGFVGEVVPAEGRRELEGRKSGEYVYRAGGGNGETVAVLVEVVANGYRLVVRRGSGAKAEGKPPPPPPPPPSTSASISASASASTSASASAEVPPALRSLIAEGAARKASDLLLSEGLAPRLRIDGDVVVMDEAATTAGEIEAMVRALGAELKGGSVDFGATLDGQRLRGHGFRHHRGVALALRLVRRDVPTLERLGLPAELTDLVKLKSGLVLVAGPTGSGKSTTLVALVGHLNRTRAAHVVSLEDPIEYQHVPDRCLVHQREIGVHADSFADGLRAALREAPDVIVVGELRDRETIGVALSAAETGHLVLGTVHAPGAAVAIDRLIDAFPEHQQRGARTQLAAVLRAVITQHLLPTRGGGRTVALERVLVTAAVATLIRKNELQMLGTHIQTGRDLGMIPLEKSLARLVRTGQVDVATARALANDLDLFEQVSRGG